MVQEASSKQGHSQDPDQCSPEEDAGLRASVLSDIFPAASQKLLTSCRLHQATRCSPGPDGLLLLSLLLGNQITSDTAETVKQ
jgi:hypothetical protein